MRSNHASSTLELPLLMIMLVPFALLAINIGFLGVGSFINDAACREAARVASQQSTKDQALNAAKLAVQSCAIAGGKVSSPTLVESEFAFNAQPDAAGNTIQIPDLTPADPDHPDLKTSDLNNAPNVTAVTKLDVKLPAPLLFSDGGLVDHVTLINSYTFPALFEISADSSSDDPDAIKSSDSPGPSTSDDKPQDDPTEE